MQFFKYHGAGNDFVMIDQRAERWLTRTDRERVAQLCHRRFGIGADGLILLQTHPEWAYEMVYFNADGGESTLCGNGGRCFAAFARHLGLADGEFRFLAIDGPHDARLVRPLAAPWGEWVELHMHDVRDIQVFDNQDVVLDTGSPHYVRFAHDIDQIDLVTTGRVIRYGAQFGPSGGINVNLVEHLTSGGLHIRTYERGVEDETLACGTGVTAAALADARLRNLPVGAYETPVRAQGGDLSVRYRVQPDSSLTDIWLCGPAQRVYEGTLSEFIE
jgi:diaminopimelate epimerase